MAGKQDTWASRPEDTTVTLVGKGGLDKLTKIVGAGGNPGTGK
jgi:hypothetical protein